MPKKDGQSLRSHLEQVEKVTGKKPAELEQIEPPYAARYIWEWFWELHQGRGAGMSGPLPLSWAEIKAWCDLRGLRLENYETDAIRSMDMAFLQAVDDESGHSNSIG